MKENVYINKAIHCYNEAIHYHNKARIFICQNDESKCKILTQQCMTATKQNCLHDKILEKNVKYQHSNALSQQNKILYIIKY